MLRWLAAAAVISIVAISMVAGAQAADVEHWTASSTTATAITGDVTLRADRITFARGVSLPIARVRNVSFTAEGGQRLPASLYRVTRPADPVLLNGNRICGTGAITFLVIWHVPPLSPGDGVGRAFAAYNGAAEPSPSVDGACGTFGYAVGGGG